MFALKNSLKSALSLVLSMSLALPAQAAGTRNNSSQAIYEQIIKIFPAIIPGASPEAQLDTTRELLSSSVPALQFPAFPRTWVQTDIERTQESNTTFGFSTAKLAQVVPGLKAASAFISVGAEHSISYKYNTKTAFVAITSLRRLNGSAPNDGRVTEYPFAVNPPDQQPGTELRQIIDFNPETRRSRFIVSEEFPMVGFCVFEASLKIAKTNEGKVEFFVGSRSESATETQGFSYAIYSNFFQIDSNVPIQDYLRIKCQQKFEEAVRFVVESDFNRIIAEFYAHYHPQNQCSLTTTQDPAGDQTCMNWFHGNSFMGGPLNPHMKPGVVPRCQQGRDGVARCVLRSKKDVACPMYMDRAGQFTSDPRLSRAGIYSKVTVDYTLDNLCDKGLTCTMTSNPWMLGPAVIWGGHAACK